MGNLPEERCDLGARPFAAICLDLLGPVTVMAMTNKRAHMKTWLILFVCQATGALHLEHEESRPEAEPGGPYDVSTSAPASTSTCAATDASVHAFTDDPGIANDRQERPHPGLAEGPKQPMLQLRPSPPL